MLWTQPLLLTLQLIAVSITIAAVIGIVGAWAASSLDRSSRLGGILSRLFLASMLVALAMPMILHAAAWEATAGKFGWIMMTQTGSRADTSGPYGFFGGLVACGWIHGLVGAALVALATWYGARSTPSAVIEQSRLEVGPIEAWWRVRLPIASPWVITSLLATAALAATEMTVVDLYGFRTLADEFYLFYAVDPSITAILMTSCLPLAICAAALTWLFVSRQRMLFTQHDVDLVGRVDDSLSRGWQCFAALIAIIVACLVVVVPVSGLLVKVGHEVVVEHNQVQASWSVQACLERLAEAPRIFADEYRWTAIVAIMTAAAALVIAWPLASIGRTHRRLQRWIDLVSIVMVTVPGPLVGLTVVSLFQINVPGFRLLYQQTLGPTTLALLVRATPVAYWILRSGYQAVDTPVLDAARLDFSWPKRMWSIDRPLLRPYLVAASLAAAVVASGDVPAMLPVIPPGVTTVGTRLFGLLHSGARYQEAALALWYLGAVVAISLICLRQGLASRVRVE